MENYKILKERSQVNFMNFSNQKNGDNLAFLITFQFLPIILYYYKIRTKTTFENPNEERPSLP